MSFPAQAILLAPGSCWHTAQRTPTELMQLVDRPVAQHAVETIVSLGCTRIDVILGSDPDRFESAIGDGQRWGVQVHYHLARDPERPYARIPAIQVSESNVLLAHADRLPSPGGVREGRIVGGWGVLSRHTLGEIPVDMTVDGLDYWLARRWELPVSLAHDRDDLLDVTTPLDFLRASGTVVSCQRSDLLRTGRERSPGVWVGWGARIHPSARLQGPLFIGEQAQVGAGAEIGPNAVVGAGAYLADGVRVADAVVQPRTYVGDALTVERAVAGEGWLVDAELDTAVSVMDPLLLGATDLASPTPLLIRTIVRLVAAVAWALTLPVQLATAAVLRVIRRGPVLFRIPVHTTWRRGRPSSPRVGELVSFDPGYGCSDSGGSRSRGWSDLLLRFLPGLLSVARGDIALVGLEPRSPRDVAVLPEPWRAVANAFPPGLITEIEADAEGATSPEARFAAEAFLVANESFGFRLRLLGRYLRRRMRWAPA